MTRRIGFFIYPTFDLLDLSGPLEVFQWAGHLVPGSYACEVMALEGGAVRSAAGLTVNAEQASVAGLDTLVVVGGGSVMFGTCPAMAALVQSARYLRRLASVCTGAFVLAAAGLLDGRAATTHWHWAARLQALYSAIRIDGDRIFIQDGRIWTSAGITAGIDMSLAMVEEDLGRDVAQAIARMLVVYYRRPGGQTQFSSLLGREPDSDRIRRALGFAREHLDERLPVERLAEVASLSVRQFGRAFLSATGTTPAKAVDRLRAEIACPRVENSRDSFDLIARDAGYIDSMRMRLSFMRVFGQSPQALRRAARVPGANSEATVTTLTRDAP